MCSQSYRDWKVLNSRNCDKQSWTREPECFLPSQPVRITATDETWSNGRHLSFKIYTISIKNYHHVKRFFGVSSETTIPSSNDNSTWVWCKKKVDKLKSNLSPLFGTAEDLWYCGPFFLLIALATLTQCINKPEQGILDRSLWPQTGGVNKHKGVATAKCWLTWQRLWAYVTERFRKYIAYTV